MMPCLLEKYSYIRSLMVEFIISTDSNDRMDGDTTAFMYASASFRDLVSLEGGRKGLSKVQSGSSQGLVRVVWSGLGIVF